MKFETGDLLSLPTGELVLVLGFIGWQNQTEVIIQKADGSSEVWRLRSLAAISKIVHRSGSKGGRDEKEL